MPKSEKGTFYCGAPVKDQFTGKQRACQVNVKADGIRCHNHVGVVLDSEITDAPVILDDETILELSELFEEHDEESDLTLFRQIRLIETHLNHLERNYRNAMEQGDLVVANARIEELSKLAELKSKLIKSNQDLVLKTNQYLPITEFEKALEDVLSILDQMMIDHPQLLHKIKQKIMGQAIEEIQENENTTFQTFLEQLEHHE